MSARIKRQTLKSFFRKNGKKRMSTAMALPQSRPVDERFSYRHLGLDFKLTGVEHARVISELMA